MRRLIIVLAVVLAATAAGVAFGLASSSDDEPSARAPVARNVVVVVGDGMGAAQRELIRLRAGGRTPVMDSLPVRGRVRTRSLDGVTDSAAAGTALATGVMTRNDVVGLDPGGRSHPALVDVARESGRATGLVTTSTVSDATPATFGGANVGNRDEQGEIARQLLEDSRVDVLLGGGRTFFAEHLARARALGYAVAATPRELRRTRARRVLGLLADRELYEQDARERPELAELTGLALRTLARDRRGFLLLVEQEATDHLAHEGDVEGVARAGAELDRAVAAVVRFAERTPGTLVVVLGDHETGGLVLERGAGRRVEARLTTGDHTLADVPLTASGPGARRLRGTRHLTGVHEVLLRALGG